MLLNLLKSADPIYYLYNKCRKWRREKRGLKKELKAPGIGWQRQPEERWIANLLANNKAVQPLLKYLMTTEVGGREEGVEKESEWERRED